MKPLYLLADRHPISAGITGITVWLLSALHDTAGVAGDVGKIAGCVVTVLTARLVWMKIRERREAARPFDARELRQKLDEDTLP